MVNTALTWIGDDKFIIAMDRTTTRDIVCARGRALGGTFASGVVDRICDCFLVGLKDLKNEYEQYYRLEYPSFKAFLFRKYGLSKRDIGALLEGESDDRIIAIGDVVGGGDYTLGQMIKSDVGQRLLGVLLDLSDAGSETEDDKHEDQE